MDWEVRFGLNRPTLWNKNYGLLSSHLVAKFILTILVSKQYVRNAHVKVFTDMSIFLIVQIEGNIISVRIWVLTHYRIATEIIGIIKCINCQAVLSNLNRKEVGFVQSLLFQE